jgi:large subunit ribosomal protein L23
MVGKDGVKVVATAARPSEPKSLPAASCQLTGFNMKLTDVIRRPLITEKTTVIREDGRTLVFQVAMDANKIDIKRAVEQLLGSKVENVRTSLAHGKMKRQGRYVGRRSDWKKAYVTLREGEKLPDFLQGA